MPLLHKASYQFRAVPQNLSDSDEVFHIPATKEIFKTYEEYISKAQLYTKEVWSCSLTGKSNLTLEEALESETTARKKIEKFPTVLEKPALLLAHHSNKNLDWMATTLTNQYKSHCAVGEIVSVSHNSDKKTAKILECVTSLDAEEGDVDMYSYKIMLLGTGEQIPHIPHSSVHRKLQMPTKELIKMYIREHTTKQSNMFNVKKEMLIKYNIPHKFASITSVLRTPKSSDRPGKKQTPKSKFQPKASPSSSSTKQKHSTPSTISTPRHTGHAPSKMIKIHSVGDDGRLVTTWKEIPLKSPQVPAVQQIVIDSDSETEKRDSSPAPIVQKEKPKKLPLTDAQKKERKQKRVENKEIKEFTAKVKTLVEKYKDQIAPKGESSGTPSSSMKQTSLLSYTSKNSISTTIREIIGAEDNVYRRSVIINDLAKCLTKSVSDKLPLATPVKSLLLEKREKLLEREKVSKMSPKKREDYYRQKEEMRIAILQKRREEKISEQQKQKDERMKQREIEREAARQARLAQQALERIIVDDLSLEGGVSLPPSIPIDLPAGHVQMSFPKVALLADAIHYFRNVFTQEEDDVIYNTDFILRAAVEGPRGHKALSNLMISMLQTLAQELGDRLKVPLLEVPFGTVDMNEFNVGACIHVYLSHLLKREEYESSELEEIVEALERQEFYDLPPHHKIHVLYVMCEEILNTQTFYLALQENIERTTRARKKLQSEQIVRNKQKQDHKLKLMQETLKRGLGGVVDTVVIDSDKEEEGEKEDEDGDEGIGSDEEDVSGAAHTVRQRQEDIKKKKEEKEEERQRKDAERIKENKFREQKALILSQQKKEENLKNEIEGLVQSVRNEPLGLDRNYAKYWIFNGTPGLYVEESWWNHATYFNPIMGNELNTSSTSERSEDSGIQEKPQQIVAPSQRSTTWHVVPSLAHFEELKQALNKRGTREKHLLSVLNKEDERIRNSIRKMNYPSRAHRFMGTVEDTVRALKKDIMTMDGSLGFAGLGGVENILQYIKQDLCTVSECSAAMLVIQESVEAKYMNKPLISTHNVSDLSFNHHKNVQVWREMVADATTYSLLNMLLSIFDNCIKWEKSIENIKCKVCKKKGDERKLLICDVCDTGYHCGCLRPPLKKVPEDSWLCPPCRPTVVESDTSSASEESSGEEEVEASNDDFCCVCEYGGELILCDKCPSAYHLLCHDPPLKRIPRGDWACFNCQEPENSSEESENESENESDSDEVEDCVVCQRGGKLVCCSDCQQMYHMKCHDPPLKAIPGKRWKCSHCVVPEKPTKSQKRGSSGAKKGKSGKKRKVEKSKPKTKKQVVASESEEEEETLTEKEEDDDDEEVEEEEPSKSSRRTRGAAALAPRSSPTKGGRREKEARSNRRCLKRGVDRNLEICEEIITDLLKIPESADFIDLVDKKKVPDYYDLIGRPICLSHIKEKTLYLQYETGEEFVHDVSTLLENCFAYNLEQSEVYENGKVLETSFLSMLKSRLPTQHKQFIKSRKAPK